MSASMSLKIPMTASVVEADLKLRGPGGITGTIKAALILPA